MGNYTWVSAYSPHSVLPGGGVQGGAADVISWYVIVNLSLLWCGYGVRASVYMMLGK